MKYVIIDETKTDIFTEEFDDAEKAIRAADRSWEHLTGDEQRSRVRFLVLRSANPDEDAVDHLDGDVIYRLK